MKFLFFIVFLTLAAAHTLAFAAPASQPPQKKDTAARRVLSYAELFAEIQACTDTMYTLKNAEVRFNPNTDQRFNGYNPPDSIAIEPTVYLSRIVFTGLDWVHWDRINFKKRLSLLNCSFTDAVQIIGTTFSDAVLLFNIAAPDRIDFEGCVFRGGISIHNQHYYAGLISFADCSFTGEFPRQARYIQHPTGYEFLVLFVKADMERTTLRVSDCSFLNPSKQGRVMIESELRSLLIVGNNFETDVSFKGSSITSKLTIQENQFHRTLDLTLLKHPGTNTICEWTEVAGKLIGSRGLAGRSEELYEAKSDSEMIDIHAYHRLLASYNDLYTIYKTRGDRESANGCYVAIKTIETRRAAYLYRKSPALETWFDWRLNQLLEVFSDYGTNSAKGLIYIFYVIIGFAALYLIFPSEADNLSREKSFRMFDVVIGYFSTNATLVNISEHKRRRALDDLQNFRTTLEVSRKDVPAFIALLGAPLYGLNKAYLGFSEWLVERFDIVPGRWNELSAGRKAWTGAAVSAYMLGFLVWGVVMRFVNAFALSINAFVTLGYGEIQARGVARYLAVLEGAIGWFLLSIFSVTLISQLLQ